MGCQGPYPPWHKTNTCRIKSIEELISGAKGTTPILKKKRKEKKNSENAGANENLSCGFQSFRNRSGSCSENFWFAYCSSRGMPFREWNSYSENGISNSQFCSENTPELSQSSENGLFAPRAYFPEIGVVPRLLTIFAENMWVSINERPRAHPTRTHTNHGLRVSVCTFPFAPPMKQLFAVSHRCQNIDLHGCFSREKPYHDQGDSRVWTGPQ